MEVLGLLHDRKLIRKLELAETYEDRYCKTKCSVASLNYPMAVKNVSIVLKQFVSEKSK